jgi:hypothetical protein
MRAIRVRLDRSALVAEPRLPPPSEADVSRKETDMPSIRRAVLLLAVVLLAIAASACGSESGLEEGAGGSTDNPAAGAAGESEDVSGQPGAGSSSQVSGASVERKITQTASMTLRVKDVGQAFQEVTRVADGAAGFVSSSSFSNQDDEQVASVTIRVPATRYQDVLSSLRGLATKVESEESQATDVTEEYTDLGSRLRNLQATEAQYLGFLERAKDISEVLLVQDRLNTVRADIETVQGRINLLDSLSDMSTITVHVRPELAAGSDGGKANPAAAARAAWDASLTTLRGLATGIVAVAAFSWWIVPILIVLAWVGRKLSPRYTEQRKD